MFGSVYIIPVSLEFYTHTHSLFTFSGLVLFFVFVRCRFDLGGVQEGSLFHTASAFLVLCIEKARVYIRQIHEWDLINSLSDLALAPMYIVVYNRYCISG